MVVIVASVVCEGVVLVVVVVVVVVVVLKISGFGWLVWSVKE